MPKVNEFTYTKENGTTSDRVVAVLHNASSNMLGIDITELEGEEYADFIEDFKHYNEVQKEALAELLNSYDLKHNYRSFKPSGMTNINNTEI